MDGGGGGDCRLSSRGRGIDGGDTATLGDTAT